MTIDGLTISQTIRPTSYADLGAQVRAAAAAGQAVYPVGGGTKLAWGLAPSKPGIAIEMTGLNQVIDYPARDMTITVQAGMTVAALQQTLAKENQQLPIDVPGPGRATIGGILATNVSGARRFGYGTLRDYLIGLTLINDRGEECQGGGRVVKNVAGYDLMKLYTGSFGTLGIIAQATFKVKPLPEASAWLSVALGEADVPAVVGMVNKTRTRPMAWSLDSQLHLHVAFEDNAKAVAWQVQQFQSELPSTLAGKVTVHDRAAAKGLLERLTEMMATPAAKTIVKLNVLASETWTVCQQLRAQGIIDWVAQAGNGIIHAHLPNDWDVTQASTVIAAVLKQITPKGGNLVVVQAPWEWKSQLPIWGAPRGDWPLMETIRKTLDPGTIFNPGRLL